MAEGIEVESNPYILGTSSFPASADSESVYLPLKTSHHHIHYLYQVINTFIQKLIIS